MNLEKSRDPFFYKIFHNINRELEEHSVYRTLHFFQLTFHLLYIFYTMITWIYVPKKT